MVLGKRDYWRLFDEQDGGGQLAGALRERCKRRPDAAALLRGVAAVARFGRSNIRRLPAPATIIAHR
jgi:hypothetical protein